jgi:hypothetical protein
VFIQNLYQMKKLIFALVQMLSIPAILVGLLVFAFSQTFAVALVIMISILIVEIILAHGFNEVKFSWDYYSGLDFSFSDKHELITLELPTQGTNILFNLTKVLTILAILGLSYIHYPKINPISDLLIAIVASVLVIFLLLFIVKSRKGYGGSYVKIRLALGMIVAICLLSFTYFYFGTQLIWLSFLLTFFFALFDGFKEIIKRTKVDEKIFIFVLLGASLLTAIVSTIFQFWGFLVKTFWFCVVFLEHHLMPALIILSLITFFFILRKLRMRKLGISQKKIADEKQRAEREKEAEREKGARLAKEEELEAKNVLRDHISQKLMEINKSLQSGEIDKEQLIFLAEHKDLFKNKVPIGSLKVDLREFVKISKLKNKITWDNNLENVLVFLGRLAARSYDDDELNFIVNQVKVLCDFVSQYSGFLAYDNFKYMIRRATQNIPYSNWFSE